MFIIQNVPSPDTIKLQGIPGRRPGTKAKDIKPGDIIMWNYGFHSKVTAVTPSKTGKSITLTLYSLDSCKTFTKKTTPDRLFAVNW